MSDYDGPIEPGMRFVYRGPGWTDEAYGPPGDLTVPPRDNLVFWNDKMLATIRAYWKPWDSSPPSPSGDPVERILAVPCRFEHGGRHGSAGHPCYPSSGGFDDVFCAARIRAALAKP